MSAFRQSVEAMIPALRRYARALTRDADAADDLVQDTLVRALRSERLFLGGDVRSWLYTILTNLNKNRRRSLARRPQFMPLLENNPDASGTEAEGRDIARALATLVEEQRAVLLLVMLEGLSYREVADIQGVPIGTVMSRLARARAHVKADVEAWLLGHPDCAKRVRAWREMAEVLHARYDEVADEAVPKRLEIEQLVRTPRKWMYGAIAAAVAAFVIGGSTGWLVGVAATPF